MTKYIIKKEDSFTHPKATDPVILNLIINENLSTGDKIQYEDGKLHRVDGPAVITPYGEYRWYIAGVEITSTVKDWIKENDLPEDYTKWTTAIKSKFTAKFSK